MLDNICSAAGLGAQQVQESDYFLGTILLLERTDKAAGKPATAKAGGTNEFAIVDGQQRLTTFAILAAVLRDLLEEIAQGTTAAARLDALLDGRGSGNSERRYRLQLGGRERSFLENFVLAPKSCRDMPEDDAVMPAESAILDVREHFLEEVGNFDREDLERLAAYACDYCHVVAIHTGDLDRAHRMFMALNGRGKPLQRNDILKSELLGEVSGPAAEAVFAAWQRAAELAGDELENLFSHIRVIFGKTSPAIMSAIRDIVVEAGGAQAFVQNELLPLAEAQALIINAGRPGSSIINAATRERLVYLSRLNGQDWVPAALLALKDYGRNPERADAIIEEIDRLAHLLRLQLLGSNKRGPRFAQLVKALREGGLESARKGPLVITRENTRTILFYLRELHERNAAVCKILLLRLNDSIAGKFTPIDTALFSVEHVLPVRPNATSEWRQIFPNAEQRTACTKSLGNFVLVSVKQNHAARNASLARKQEIYRKPDSGTPLLRLTQDLIEAKSWRPEDVMRREERLIGEIGRLWRVDFSALTGRGGGGGDNGNQRSAAE